MKKINLFFLIFFMAIALSACGQATQKNVEVEAEQVIVQNVFAYQVFQFEIPAGWQVLSQEEQLVSLDIGNQVRETILFSEEKLLPPESEFVTARDGLHVYSLPCEYSLGCFVLEDSGAFTLMNWLLPESMEEIGVLADGLDSAAVLEIVKTIKRAE